jgi:hypothetical protein
MHLYPHVAEKTTIVCPISTALTHFASKVKPALLSAIPVAQNRPAVVISNV